MSTPLPYCTSNVYWSCLYGCWGMWSGFSEITNKDSSLLTEKAFVVSCTLSWFYIFSLCKTAVNRTHTASESTTERQWGGGGTKSHLTWRYSRDHIRHHKMAARRSQCHLWTVGWFSCSSTWIASSSPPRNSILPSVQSVAAATTYHHTAVN